MLYTEVLEALESDEHLEHFGIKGMRWGSRKNQNSSSSTSKTHQPMSIQTKKKIAASVGAALLGGLAVGVLGKNIKQIREDKALVKKNDALVKEFFSQHKSTSFSDIDKLRSEFGLSPIFG